VRRQKPLNDKRERGLSLRIGLKIDPVLGIVREVGVGTGIIADTDIDPHQPLKTKEKQNAAENVDVNVVAGEKKKKKSMLVMMDVEKRWWVRKNMSRKKRDQGLNHHLTLNDPVIAAEEKEINIESAIERVTENINPLHIDTALIVLVMMAKIAREAEIEIGIANTDIVAAVTIQKS
jgi:cytochrome oxidase assembly protein ShyY1